jgi:hypothetical protein
MKIGILTFHCAHNYGAVLQCFGLQKFLSDLGQDVYVIDYRPKYLTEAREYLRNSPRLFFTKRLRYLPIVFMDAIKFYKLRTRKWDSFENFISQKLNLYPYTNGFDGNALDLCVVGSDQVWNKNITGGDYDPVFFAENFKCQAISYAASTIINDNSNSEGIEMLKRYLYNFKKISVREKHIKEQLNCLCDDLNIEVVLDPTLLVGPKPFLKLVQTASKKRINEPYILIYMVKTDIKLYDYASYLSKKHGLKIIEIANDFNSNNSERKIYDASVEEFLALIYDAKYVVTNSFHGTAFCILFHKIFYAIRQNAHIDDRIEQLLSSVGLLNRFIQYNDFSEKDDIDFSIVDIKLEKERESSADFLKKSIWNIQNK